MKIIKHILLGGIYLIDGYNIFQPLYGKLDGNLQPPPAEIMSKNYKWCT